MYVPCLREIISWNRRFLFTDDLAYTICIKSPIYSLFWTALPFQVIVGNLRLKAVEPEMVSDAFVPNLIVFIEYTSNERVVLCMQFQTYDHISLKIFHIMQTCPCNEDPLTPHVYIVKLECTGVYIFLIFALKYRLWVLVRTASLRRF